MNAETQGNYTLRKTNNYFDLIEGRNYHAEPLTFAEFLAKPESLFIYEPSFFQVPGYVQQGAEVQAIEDEAREYVVDWIIDALHARARIEITRFGAIAQRKNKTPSTRGRELK